MLAMFALQAYLFSGEVETLPHSDFRRCCTPARSRKCRSASRSSAAPSTAGIDDVLGKARAEAARGHGDGPRAFSSVRVADPSLVQELEAAHVRFTGQMDNKVLGTVLSWVLPALIFFAIWSLLIRRIGGAAGGLMEIGKSKAKVYMQTETGVTFADVAGIDEAKQELAEIVDFLRSRAATSAWAARFPRACCCSARRAPARRRWRGRWPARPGCPSSA